MSRDVVVRGEGDLIKFSGGAGDHGFFIEKITGLLGGVSGRADRKARPQKHGEYDVPTYRDARIVAWNGLCHTRSPEDMEQHSIMLSGWLVEQGGIVTIDTPSRTVWGRAELADETPELTPVVWGEVSEYDVMLRFSDPRLYGETHTFTGSTPVFHRGNTSATPVFTVTGSQSGGYTIGGPSGKTYTVTEPLVSGRPHVIDMKTGLLRVNGSIVFGGTSSADLWAIPGGAQVSHSITTGVNLSTALTDTYF